MYFEPGFGGILKRDIASMFPLIMFTAYPIREPRREGVSHRKSPRFCGQNHGRLQAAALPFVTVATKYYTHFVTGSNAPPTASANEWSGVVELRHPLENVRGTRELRSLLAQSFDLDSDDIKILHWARLH